MFIEDKLICKNIHGTYQKGDIVFISGESGKGKSTLVKNLLKFRQCDSIYLNGFNINEYTNHSIREKVEFISQTTPIFKGTLRDNILFGIKHTNDLEKLILENSLISSLFNNKTLDSEINEGASNLSGGEKQKIAIMRAICKKSEVLILDEFTSNIDKNSTDDIMKMIKDISTDKIIFIISHDDMANSYANKKLILE